jgi:predicted  nucleic acid-binding Zn-ribbon protein
MTKELTVSEKLKHLYELQLIDSQIDEIKILKGELPIEVGDLEDEIVGLETRIRRLSEQVADLEGEISKHKANIKESEGLMARYQKQMDNVKNNREYDALSKELELQRLEIQLSEKKIREAQQNLENKQETLTTNQQRFDAKQKDLETKKVELSDIIEKTEKEENELIKQSDKAKEGLDERLIKAYLKIRENYRNGLAVVQVERDSCGGCYNKIPPQIQLEIAMRKKIVACEHCGRILVDNHILEPEQEETAE